MEHASGMYSVIHHTDWSFDILMTTVWTIVGKPLPTGFTDATIKTATTTKSPPTQQLCEVWFSFVGLHGGRIKRNILQWHHVGKYL